jgi:hypothetical protein
VKNTMMFRSLANPRRTQLADLTDAGELATPEAQEHTSDLPNATANPRRTVLDENPAAGVTD